jgi:shikimate dehydrogenase
MAGAVTTMRITGRTRILFILAHPVDHVRGSDLLNQRFLADGLDVAVSPLHVHPEDLGTVIRALRHLRNVAGFGVTIPHKIAVLPLLDGLTERARQVGSVNFVRRHADGSLLGDNLDGQGFVDGLVRCGIELRGRRVLQLGAGGAGRAVAFAIQAAGARELIIFNRHRQKAADLVAELAAAHPGCAVREGAPDVDDVDVIVNTTSQGMHPGDPPLFDYLALGPRHAVADIVMSPEMTPMLEAAKARGCRLGLGTCMLQAQYPLVRALLEL